MATCNHCGQAQSPERRFVGYCQYCGAPYTIEIVTELIEIAAASVPISETAAEYLSWLRAPVRGLWSGVMDYDQFWDVFSRGVRRGLTQAWYEGAAQAGIKPDELSPEEKMSLEAMIINQYQYIGRLANEIEQRSKANGGKLGPLMARVDAWANRWEEALNRGRMMAAADLKLVWTLGVAEHCSSCMKLAGKVKRSSFWQAAGIIPRVPGARYLECRGYRCQCDLLPTDAPLSRGPLPRLP